MEPPERLRVEVVHARPDVQRAIRLSVPAGSTVWAAVAASGILGEFPDLDPARDGVGIYGQACRLDDFVGDGDRIELYRPLAADPKESRRRRAAEAGD